MTVLAVGFVNAWMLSGLALVAVPIIIHLLARRQFRVVDWGAMRFLLEAEKENRRRVKFEQWLLLALRCLAMALLALLFVRPFVEPGVLTRLVGRGGQVQRIIVLDDSASMAARGDSGAEYASMRTALVRLLEWLRATSPEDPVSLWRTSSPDAPWYAAARLDDAALADMRERLERSAPSDLRAWPRRVLTSVAAQLSAAPDTAHDIYLFADFQRTDWAGGEDGAAPPLSILRPPAETGNDSPAPMRVFLVSGGSSTRGNVAVQGIRMERAQSIVGQPAVARVELVNYQQRALENLTIELALDGQPLPALSVTTLEAGGVARVATEITFPAPGFHELTATCTGRDGFPIDDVWRSVIEVKSRLNVLLVNGEPNRDPLLDGAYLLQAALAPPGPLSSGLQVETIDAAELGAVSFDSYDVVVLCNVAPPPEGIVQSLERYVAQGGGLLMALGDAVLDAATFNGAWDRGGAGLAPLLMEDIARAASEDAGWRLRRTGDDAITALFPGEDEPLSEYVRFRAFVRCRERDAAAQADGSTAAAPSRGPRRTPTRVLARFTDDAASPALAACDFGRGRVLMYTSTVNLDWTDWARSVDGSYVVTFLEAVQQLAARPADPPSILAGDPLRVTISPEQFEPFATFRSPARVAEPPLPAQPAARELLPGELLVLQGPAAARVGTYQAELTRRVGGKSDRPLAVNLPPAESDLTSATRSELSAALGDVPHEFINTSESFFAGAEPPRRELWKLLLIAAVATLIAEHMLAWWFGGGRLRLKAPLRVQRA